MKQTFVIISLLLFTVNSDVVFSQESENNANSGAVITAPENSAPGSGASVDGAENRALADLQEGDNQVKKQEEDERLEKEKEAKRLQEKGNGIPDLNLLDLIKKGGPLMWPIGFLSVLGLMFALERFVALRRGAIMPGRLFRQISRYLEPGAFSPQAVWNICEDFPSPAARVIQAMLLKAGRPLPEIETAAAAAKQEEATNMYNNVRWLTLVATLAPLLGLLGTVWGMIEAFYVTANMEIGGNRGELLSSGIYVALVTTAAGLVVAIPAAMIAHWYEGKILNAFRALDPKLLPLFDQLEKLEGTERLGIFAYRNKHV